MKKLRILFTAVLGLFLLSCEQKDIYFSHDGGDQGLEVTTIFGENNPLPEGLNGDIYSFSFIGDAQLFNAYHGVNPYNPPFMLDMEAGTYDMLFMTSDMYNIENMQLNWGEDNEDKSAEPAYFEFKDVEQESEQGGYEYINSPFKDKEWYMGTSFVEHASSFPVHTAEPPVWMASYERDVVIDQAAEGGISPTVPTGHEGDSKVTKLTTYPQQMVFQPTFTVKIFGITDVDAVYMSVVALKGGAPLIPGYADNAPAITYEAQMELTDNGDGSYTATRKFNTFGLDSRASQFGQNGGGNVCIVIENSAVGAASSVSCYNFDVTEDESKYGKTMSINDELDYNTLGINIVEENLQFTLQSTHRQEQQLTLEYDPTDAVNKGVTWSSDNERAVTVDQNGKITIVGVGKAKITATLIADNSISDFCDVTVDEPAILVTEISYHNLANGLHFSNIGETKDLSREVTVLPDNATNKVLSWSIVSGSDVVSVDPATGVVKALAAGTAVVRASATDGSGVTRDLSIKVWKPSFTITFDAQGGTPTGSTWLTDENGTLVSSWLSIPTPTQQGLDFAGWFSEAKGGSPITDTTVFTENTTVYAQWQSQAGN